MTADNRTNETTPERWRKKPVEIEAMRYDGENWVEIAQWLRVHDVRIGQTGTRKASIPTLEGTMYASPGDWIIKGVQGEFYPCKPDIFEQTYERAALVAAQGAAPQKHPTFEEIGEDIARGIRDSLSGVAPQVPNQNETKSGNNFVSLDPEKVAAQGAEPQAESADHEKLIARLTGSVNALSVTCGECGSKPGNRCYGGGEMRRGHTSREAKAERALRIEAADALAALVLPSSGVDEVRAEAVREVARYINRIAPNGLVPKKMILADMEFAADRLGRGIHANGNDRAVQGGESRGE